MANTKERKEWGMKPASKSESTAQSRCEYWPEEQLARRWTLSCQWLRQPLALNKLRYAPTVPSLTPQLRWTVDVFPRHHFELFYESCGDDSHIISKPVLTSHYMTKKSWERTLNLCTERPPTECDDTRCCIIQFWPPDDEHIVLEKCRGI